MNNTRKIDGPTPSGGVYAMLYFYDDNNNPVSEEQATKAYGVEFDENDKIIKETYFLISHEKNDKNTSEEKREDFDGNTIEIPSIK